MTPWNTANTVRFYKDGEPCGITVFERAVIAHLYELGEGESAREIFNNMSYPIHETLRDEYLPDGYEMVIE